MTAGLTADQEKFYDRFTREFFSADGVLKVTEEQRQEALALCQQADKKAALGCMNAFGTTDFRDDLPKVTVPTLVLHGDSDAHRPVRGLRASAPTRRSPAASCDVIHGAPHGFNVSHADEFNQALIAFLQR